MSLLTSLDPVKATLSTSGCITIASPALPNPGTMFTTPGGNPASFTSSATYKAVSGVCSAGLRTTVFPKDVFINSGFHRKWDSTYP